MHVRELANELTSRNERIDTTSPVPLPRKLLFVSVGQLLETEFKPGEETRPCPEQRDPQVPPFSKLRIWPGNKTAFSWNDRLNLLISAIQGGKLVTFELQITNSDSISSLSSPSSSCVPRRASLNERIFTSHDHVLRDKRPSYEQ